MQEILMSLKEAALEHAPSIGGALLVLVTGWIVAILFSSVVRSLLAKTQLHQRMASWFTGDGSGTAPDVPKTAGRAVFWIIILLTLLAVSQVLDLTMAAGPLSGLTNQLFEYLPKLFGAGLLLLIAWIIARVVRLIASKALVAAGVDRKLAARSNTDSSGELAVSKSVGETLYWIVFLLFLPAILGALQLEGILSPVQSMLDSVLAFLPKLVGAALIVIVGWFVARIIRSIVSNLITAAGGDKLAARYGITSLSRVVGLVVYALILLPVIIGALNALQLTAITAPASAMLSQVLSALPSIFGAALIIVIAVVLGRFLSGVVTRLLSGLGIDNLPTKLGFSQSQSAEGRKLSDIAGVIVLVTITFFAAIEAAGMLGFGALSMLISELIVFAGKIGLGLVILTLGLYLSNLAASAVRSSNLQNSHTLAVIARVTVLAIVGSMAIRQMGIADDIVHLAFGLTLGAIAVATAIAFGVGGRDIAARKLATWTKGDAGNETAARDS